LNLTPFVPLSFKGEGEEKERGASAPLGHLYRQVIMLTLVFSGIIICKEDL